MRFGLSVPNMGPVHELVDLAVAAEAAGWDGVFLWDHLRYWRDFPEQIHDPWTVLGAIAARTERVRLGTLVTPLARRRPWVVAKQLTTLDHLSDGRATLSVGLGEEANADFGDFGDPMGGRERAALLDEGLDIVAALLTGDPVTYEGDRNTLYRAGISPTPVQSPRPPIWVGGGFGADKPLARALRWDGYAPFHRSDGFLTPEQVAEAMAGVDRPAGWDLVISRAPDTAAADYDGLGVSWLMDSTWPAEEGWLAELRSRVDAGPVT